MQVQGEGQDVFPYNAGIMLMNMPYVRKTNKKFLNWIVSQKNGLYYPGKWQYRGAERAATVHESLHFMRPWHACRVWPFGPGCPEPVLREADQGQTN